MSGPNAKEIAAFANHYCAQRDPRRTARAIGDVMAECARRLSEGHTLNGTSFEALATMWITDDLPRPTRDDLVKTAAAYVEMIAMFDLDAETTTPRQSPDGA